LQSRRLLFSPASSIPEQLCCFFGLGLCCLDRCARQGAYRHSSPRRSTEKCALPGVLTSILRYRTMWVLQTIALRSNDSHKYCAGAAIRLYICYKSRDGVDCCHKGLWPKPSVHRDKARAVLPLASSYMRVLHLQARRATQPHRVRILKGNQVFQKHQAFGG
jgi:hypothetical protein